MILIVSHASTRANPRILASFLLNATSPIDTGGKEEDEEREQSVVTLQALDRAIMAVCVDTTSLLAFVHPFLDT